MKALPKFQEEYSAKIPALTLQTQWGSCSPHGRITLNPHLVKVPRECIDYVILHGLCHITTASTFTG